MEIVYILTGWFATEHGTEERNVGLRATLESDFSPSMDSLDQTQVFRLIHQVLLPTEPFLSSYVTFTRKLPSYQRVQCSIKYF